MAIHLQCDFCGQPIEDDDDLKVSIDARGNAYNPDGYWGSPGRRHEWVSGHLGHYHASEERSCWAEMLDRIQLIHSVSMNLGLTTEAIEQKRSELATHDEVVERQRKVHDREREGWDEHRRRCQQWHDLSQEERERLVLEVLGDEHATVSELAAKLNTRFGWPTQRPRGDRGPHSIPPIGSEDARSIAMRLLDQGTLGRLSAPHKNSHAVWHFFRVEATTPTETVV